MRLMKYALSLLIALSLFSVAAAQEEIRRFAVDIEVEQDGDIVVTETIAINVEGRNIRRGIFRDFPAYYLDEDDRGRLPFRYKVLSVTRNGEREPYSRDRVDNAVRLQIGEEDRFLEYREHVYEIRYRVKNQIRYFEDYDVLYWNVTGVYWQFPILQASTSIVFPPGLDLIDTESFTGPLGAAGTSANYRREGNAHVFSTTEPLGANEGLTFSMRLEKGLIDPPSWSDESWLWWARYGSLTALVVSCFGLFGFYYTNYERVGRDPAKGPVFPRYAPPKGYSPAAAHHIYYRGFRGHDGLIASLMYLAANGHLRIEVDKKDKKKTTLFNETGDGQQRLTPELANLRDQLFEDKDKVKLGEKYDAEFTEAYTDFRKDISDTYGEAYFKWNPIYVVVGGVLSVFTMLFAILQHSYWSLWHTLSVVALIGLNGLFMYLMPAPTRKGQDIRTQLEGFRLYMEKAEKLQLNSVEVGSEKPPPMTVKRYETFLPYAVALGVEKPWTKHFERLIPKEAADYNPAWTNVSANTFGSIGGMTDSMVSGMSSGVTSAMPQSSSSSGGGGGGFSGGGGGGGGGGGW